MGNTLNYTRMLFNSNQDSNYDGRSLAALPADLWEQITFYLDHKDLSNLLCLGDSHLAHLLTKLNGVTHLNVVYDRQKFSDEPIAQMHRFPTNSIRRFQRTKSLYISWTDRGSLTMLCYKHTYIDIESLPPELEYLWLNYQAVESFELQSTTPDKKWPLFPLGLKTFISTWSSWSPHLSYALPKTITTLNLREGACLWNEIRNSNFPSLQNFSAYELRERITTPHPEWPKNFKSIRISIHGKIPLNIFEGVPDTLEKISLGLSADIGLVLDFLPSYTRSVVIPCVTVFSESNAFKLPQHLTSLNISGVVKVPISTLERFNLTWLDIASDRDNLSDDTAPLLPRTLTYLNMDKNQACTNSALKWLPRGLTELTANDNLNFSDEGIEDLPRSLIKLSLEWNQKILSHSIAKLPRTLTFLNMANNRRLDNTAVPLLPRRLTYLDLNENILIDDSVVHLFPPYLTHLDMDRSRKITFSVFTSKLPSLLRGHLQTLFIYCSQSQFTDYKELERLPACLKFISMAEIKDANQVRLSRQDWRVGHLWIRDYARNRYK